MMPAFTSWACRSAVTWEYSALAPSRASCASAWFRSDVRSGRGLLGLILRDDAGLHELGLPVRRDLGVLGAGAIARQLRFRLVQIGRPQRPRPAGPDPSR